MRSKEEATAFIKSIMGPNRRQLFDKEYKDIMFLLKLTDPYHSSNNQRTWTDEYKIAGKIYHVTYGLEDDPVIEEVETE